MSSIILMVLDRIFNDFQSTIRINVIELLTTLTESKATLNLYLHYYLRVGMIVQNSFQKFQNNILSYYFVLCACYYLFQYFLMKCFDLFFIKFNNCHLLHFIDKSILQNINVNLLYKITKNYLLTSVKIKKRQRTIMSSTKNHTKNELARISAKINELKRKYPSSSSQQNYYKKSNKNHQNENMFYNPDYNNSNQFSSKQNSNQNNCLKQRSNSILLQKKLNRNHQDKLNANNEYINLQKQKCSLPLKQNRQNRAYDNIIQNKENQILGEIHYSKSFNQYKKQLTNLKKQILSSLDFQNYQLNSNKNSNFLRATDQKIQHQRREQNNQQRKNSKQRINSAVNIQIKSGLSGNALIHQAQSQNQSGSHVNETFSKNFFQSSIKNQEQHNYEKVQRMLAHQQQSSDQENYRQNYKSSQTNTYQNFSDQSNQFLSFRQSAQMTFRKLCDRIQRLQVWNKQERSHTQSLEQQLNGLKNNYLKSIMQFQEKTNSNLDLKIIQLQTQSMNKIDKQLHKEIDRIYQQLSRINQQIQASKNYQLYNSNSTVKQSFSRGQTFVESVIFQQLKLKQQQMMQLTQESIKQFQNKFKRDIFDMKNEIQLLNQKFIKADYMQKSLKSLIGSTKQSQLDKIQYKKDLQVMQMSIIQKIKGQIVSLQSFNKSKKQQLSSVQQDQKYQEITKRIYQIEKNMGEQIQSKQSIEKGIEQLNQNVKTILQQSIQNKKYLSEWKQFKEFTLQFNTNLQVRLASQFIKIQSCIRQFQTKMVSYSLLLQSLQDEFRQINPSRQSQKIFKNSAFASLNAQILNTNHRLSQVSSNCMNYMNHLQQKYTELQILYQQLKQQKSVQPNQQIKQGFGQSYQKQLPPLLYPQPQPFQDLTLDDKHVMEKSIIKKPQALIYSENVNQFSRVKVIQPQSNEQQVQMPQKQQKSVFLLSQLVKNSMTFNSLQF